MDKLQTLKEKNQKLPFHAVTDPAFRRFGRVIDFDAASLIAQCETSAEMPAEGCRYVPVMPELEALPDCERVGRVLRGEGAFQIGCCWGYNTMLNCLEYHRASEHLIAVSDLALLLAPQQDMEGFDLPEGKLEAFFVPKGAVVEVYATTLHYAPCQASDAGFRGIIILPRGTNEPLTAPRPQGGDGRLLWAVDKWLIAHESQTETIAGGAYPGLHGENFEIAY